MMYYKLYHREAGYKCQVTIQELRFLFGIDSDDIERIKAILIYSNTGYYIK